MYAYLFSRMFITYSTHLIILYFIAKLIFGKEYKSLSSSYAVFLYTPVISCLVVQILSSASVPEHPQFVLLPQ